MNSKRIRKLIRLTGIAAAILLCLCLCCGFAVYTGILQLNRPSRRAYPIRGVDVSHYQGTINWPVLASQGIDFAYIKATEGSSHTDERFEENWKGAGATELKIGAYHFFSFDSPAESQLSHFIETVPKFDDMLPPAVDFEFYGDKEQNPPDAVEVTAQLETMLNGLKEHYGVRPVIYATEDTFRLYLKDRECAFQEYGLWIRNVTRQPYIGDRSWTFWQYTNRKKLRGYEGVEPFIDMNVFNGDEDYWEHWFRNRELAGCPAGARSGMIRRTAMTAGK